MAQRGRPPKVLDAELAADLAAIHCTDEEMAPILGCSVPTLRAAKERDPKLLAAIETARAEGKRSLRRKLFKLADTHPAAAIFLAKNWLGMSDRHEVTGKDGEPVKTEATVTVQGGEYFDQLIRALTEAGVLAHARASEGADAADE